MVTVKPYPKASSRPTLYIYERKPYVIRIKGRQVGEAQTLSEAQELRDAALARKP